MIGTAGDDWGTSNFEVDALSPKGIYPSGEVWGTDTEKIDLGRGSSSGVFVKVRSSELWVCVQQ